MSIIKKVIGMVLVLGLTVGILAGCGSSKVSDDAVMTVNGDEVSYDLFKYWMMYAASYYDYYYSSLNWDEEVTSEINAPETVTISEAVKEIAEDMCVHYLVMEQYATEMGIEITDEDIQGYKDAINENFDTDEELQAYLDKNSATMDVLVYLNKVADMYSRSFEEKYGTAGELLSDEEVAAYAESAEYSQAKHILFSTVNEDSTEMDDEGKAAQKAKAEEVLALLGAYEGDDITAYFDELMQEYSEDPGLSSYPDGYLYTSGTMVTAFEDAVDELGDNEYSGIVGSDYGYHIIMRVPVDYDAVSSSDTNGYTLRYLAATAAYEEIIAEKMESAKVEYTDLFETIVPQKVFEAVQASLEADSEATTSDAETETSDSSSETDVTGTDPIDATDSVTDDAEVGAS